MLKFAKLSLMSFIYEVLETFCFPDENVREIFKKYSIEKVEIYHIVTNTNSTSLEFLFISDPNSETPESKYREIIFEVTTSSKYIKDLIAHTSIGIISGRGKNKNGKNWVTLR